MTDNIVRLNGQQIPELGEPIESLIKTQLHLAHTDDNCA